MRKLLVAFIGVAFLTVTAAPSWSQEKTEKKAPKKKSKKKKGEETKKGNV